MLKVRNVILQILFLSIFLSSCNEKYISEDYIPPFTDTLEYERPLDRVPVMMAINNPYYISISRGIGAIDANPELSWKKRYCTFYIYSFLARNSRYSGDIDYTKKYSLDAVESKTPPMCLVDDPNTGKGAPAKLAESDSSADYSEELREDMLYFVGDNPEYYYSQVHQEHKYNFFAYSIDDAEIHNNEVIREKDRIYMDIKIDGTQDIITAVARPTKSQIDTQFESNIDKYKEKWLFENIINGNLLYSTATGHRSIYPTLHAKHCMSRFVFNLQGEDAMSDSIYIQDIYMMAQRDWRLTVAANDTTLVGLKPIPGVPSSLDKVRLCEEREDGAPEGHSNVGLTPFKYSVAQGEVINNLGMGLLLPPADRYDLYIHCAYRSKDGVLRSYIARYNISNRVGKEERPFVAGAEYHITMHVYGYQPIQLSLEGLSWGEPEYIEVNDEDFSGGINEF